MDIPWSRLKRGEVGIKGWEAAGGGIPELQDLEDNSLKFSSWDPLSSKSIPWDVSCPLHIQNLSTTPLKPLPNPSSAGITHIPTPPELLKLPNIIIPDNLLFL